MAVLSPTPKPRPTKRRVVVGQIVAGRYEYLDASPEAVRNTRAHTRRMRAIEDLDFRAFCLERTEDAS